MKKIPSLFRKKYTAKKLEKKFGLTPKIEEIGSVYVHTGKGLPIGWLDNKTFKKNKIVTYIIAIISIS